MTLETFDDAYVDTSETVSSGMTPPPELVQNCTVQEVLRSDAIAPAETLLESSDYSLGDAPIDVERYYTQEFHDLEVAKMWPKVWQYAAWSFDMPNPGDVVVYRNVGQSVVVVRQKDLSLKAFVNVCLHRAREICNADGRKAQLRCPYHGFTWSLEGDLKWVPSQWDFPRVTAEDYALPQVRVEEWNGFIFINMDENAPSLIEYMGGMATQWETAKKYTAKYSGWDFTKKYKAVHVEKLINSNWKVCMEAFIEGLHVFASHPEMAPMLQETGMQYDIYPDEPHFSRMQSVSGFASTSIVKAPTEQDVVDSFTSIYLPEIYGTEFGSLQEGETARQAFVRFARKVMNDRLGLDVSTVPDSELIDGTEYLLFPNFAPWPSIANPIVYRFRPGDGPDWCIWETMIFLPFDGERPPSTPVVKLGPDDKLSDIKELGYLAGVLQQDADQIPLVQRGLKASKTKKVTLAKYQESRLRHYNQTIDKYINS